MQFKKLTILILSIFLLTSGTGAKNSNGAKAADSETFNINLDRGVVSYPASGRVVVTMAATGDLRGALSLHLDRGANGNVTGGDWALVVAYSTTDPHEGGRDNTQTTQKPEGFTPDHPGEPHSDYEKFINKGTIHGTIGGGTIQINADGTVTGLEAVQLVFAGGSMEFGEFRQGSGSLSGSGLHTGSDSSGTMTLTLATN